MAGVYIHIPFCKSRCSYCGFYSTTRTAMQQRYVGALCREMEMRKAEAGSNTVETIYLGGGTPSQLSAEQLRQLFLYINKVYGTQLVQEVTIECNPDDITQPFVAALSQLPVNRVSMGVQTFSNERLRFLHRRHTAEQVPAAIGLLREGGIHNISIDLMYGFPDETLADWLGDIRQALSLDVQHVSAYALMYEEGTPLYRMLEQRQVVEADEELSLQMYEALIDMLCTAGYEHYEISNFARKGFRSRHNSSYWNRTPYIGLGAAAHSYDGSTRSWNIDDLEQYIEGIESGQRRAEHEELSAATRYNDLVLTALRTCDGLPLDALSPQERVYCIEQAQRFLTDGQLRLTANGHLKLTRRGLFVSNMVMSQLMNVDDD